MDNLVRVDCNWRSYINQRLKIRGNRAEELIVHRRHIQIDRIVLFNE